ncbi:unnamed protein product [Trichogramma brassicae]|uniref:Uncharacterized protein n=1 Tax=Trichogramma brassicae TaxID=86971 RepID=A0A6H5ICB7_9HYME|nr:unnamed protein product [Trichogramma brassicae]
MAVLSIEEQSRRAAQRVRALEREKAKKQPPPTTCPHRQIIKKFYNTCNKCLEKISKFRIPKLANSEYNNIFHLPNETLPGTDSKIAKDDAHLVHNRLNNIELRIKRERHDISEALKVLNETAKDLYYLRRDWYRWSYVTDLNYVLNKVESLLNLFADTFEDRHNIHCERDGRIRDRLQINNPRIGIRERRPIRIKPSEGATTSTRPVFTFVARVTRRPNSVVRLPPLLREEYERAVFTCRASGYIYVRVRESTRISK